VVTALRWGGQGCHGKKAEAFFNVKCKISNAKLAMNGKAWVGARAQAKACGYLLSLMIKRDFRGKLLVTLVNRKPETGKVNIQYRTRNVQCPMKCAKGGEKKADAFQCKIFN
jgi:hypothetical protein